MNALLILMRRDLLLALRRKNEVFIPLFFFIIVASLFPFGLGSDLTLLRDIAPGILWVAALLATMLGLSRMFEPDYADGTLEQMIFTHVPLTILAAGKIIVHWLVYGLPLVLLVPLLAMQYGLDAETQWVMVLALLIGTPLMSLIGSMCAALTLGVRGSNLLLPLLVLPLYIPALVMGAGAVNAYSIGLGADGHLSLLAAQLILALCFAPWVTAVALKVALE